MWRYNWSPVVAAVEGRSISRRNPAGSAGKTHSICGKESRAGNESVDYLDSQVHILASTANKGLMLHTVICNGVQKV